MKTAFVLSLMIFMPFIAQAKTKAPPKSVVYTTQGEDVKITWEGKKIIGGGHHGTLKLKQGKLETKGDQIVGGEFEIDMTTLTDEDLTDEGMNKKLTNHLKSDDFFSIEKHPTALLKILKAEKKEGDQHLISGDLTIKGIKKPISFPATIKRKDGVLQVNTSIKVDRTLYNIRYNSLKFFSAIGDKAISDEFTVNVEAVAKK